MRWIFDWRVMWGWASAIAFVCIGLTACATQPAKLPPPTPVATCLPLKAYTKAQQQRAVQELAKLPSDSVVAGMMVDYLKLRDADRACQSSK